MHASSTPRHYIMCGVTSCIFHLQWTTVKAAICGPVSITILSLKGMVIMRKTMVEKALLVNLKFVSGL